MITYYVSATSVLLELLILSGGTTVTGRTPYAEVRDKDTGFYFDFNTRTFTGTTVSSTAPLASAIDGLYRTTWDVSGIFATPRFLTVEYHDATALSIDDMHFRRTPVTTADANVTAAGGGPIIIKGNFTAKDRDRLKNTEETVQEIETRLRADVLPLLRGLLNKKTIESKDIVKLTRIKEKDELMWQELLKVLKLREDSTTKDVLKKLAEYNKMEEDAKKEVLALLEEKLKPEKIDAVSKIRLDTEDDD